jgi:hypothetical protein
VRFVQSGWRAFRLFTARQSSWPQLSAMIRKAALLPLMAAFAAAASAEPTDEDELHRADRLRTEQLNRQAAAAVSRRTVRNDSGDTVYRAARARYERDMAEWRRRVEACEAGHWQACR